MTITTITTIIIITLTQILQIRTLAKALLVDYIFDGHWWGTVTYLCYFFVCILTETRRAFASVRSCKIWVGVIVVVPGGKQSPILLHRLSTIHIYVLYWVFIHITKTDFAAEYNYIRDGSKISWGGGVPNSLRFFPLTTFSSTNSHFPIKSPK